MALTRPHTPDGGPVSSFGSFASSASTGDSYGSSSTVSTVESGASDYPSASVIFVELKDPKLHALQEVLEKGTLTFVEAAQHRAALTQMIQNKMDEAQVSQEHREGVNEFLDTVFDQAEQLQKRSDDNRCGNLKWLRNPFCDFDWTSALGILWWIAILSCGTFATYTAVVALVFEARRSFGSNSPGNMRVLYDRIRTEVNRGEPRDVEMGPVPPLQVPPQAHST